MEDLAAAVQSILNDPQSMAQLQGVMNSLGMNPAASPCPGLRRRCSKNRRAAAPLKFAEHSKQQRSDDGDAFAAPRRFWQAQTAKMTPRDCLRRLRPLLGEARQKKLG